MAEMRTIGWYETVDLPELGLYNFKAKIDTGARTSVLHCEEYHIEEENGHKFIQCTIIDDFETESTRVIRFPIVRQGVVKSSFGHSEIRYMIFTKIKLFDQLYNIKLSFRNRSGMKFPMLLGRNFISKKFLVDVSKYNLSENSSL
ncbi:ATP-dependent zinc protease family protein [Sphingobacterium spiritivorum]|uniref:ATP-dependent zinc protease family protein n=1 Tax=Sphingobacterium TaxID=28453 RepID=UPI0019188244|nr:MULTISPECIES: RimK/LysX family protein [Sphingobacterium]QQT26538.1 ATP-dependent zinc protease [Sphingobacterium spiritivorum]